MGMFDSIYVDCPKCKAPIEFQSKSGACCLRDYSLWNVPPEVVAGTREVKCRCGMTWKLVLPPMAPEIRDAADPALCDREERD